MGSTHKDLVVRLNTYKLPHYSEQSKRIVRYIIAKAKQGHYHDFASKLATPKMQLVTDLRQAGLEDIAKDVMNGLYDSESPEDKINA